VADQRILEAEPDDRRAEQQQTVEIIRAPGGPADEVEPRLALRFVGRVEQYAAGEEQRDRDIHQEEQHQERLGAGEHGRLIGLKAPGETQDEGAGEADEVERPPRLEPGDGEDAGIEQGQIGEQRDMMLAAGRGQDRRRKTAGGAGHGQAERILRHREDGREQHDRDQQEEAEPEGNQRVEMHGREDGEVHHRDRAALQHQPVGAAALAQPPADREQDQADHADAGIAQLDRQRGMLGRIAQQESEPQEQQQNAEPGHGIAAEQPTPGGGEGEIDRPRRARRGPNRRLCGRLGFGLDLGGGGDHQFRRGDRFRFGQRFGLGRRFGDRFRSGPRAQRRQFGPQRLQLGFERVLGAGDRADPAEQQAERRGQDGGAEAFEIGGAGEQDTERQSENSEEDRANGGNLQQRAIFPETRL
jgi:hypothetical protein